MGKSRLQNNMLLNSDLIYSRISNVTVIPSEHKFFSFVRITSKNLLKYYLLMYNSTNLTRVYDHNNINCTLLLVRQFTCIRHLVSNLLPVAVQ